MQCKQSSLVSLLRVGVFAAVAMGTVALMAADVTGNWTWTPPARGGGRGPGGGGPGGPGGPGGGPGGPGGAGPGGAAPAPAPITAKLKADGAKLTGTISFPGRGGGDPTEGTISDGKIDGDKISFNVVRDFGGNSVTNMYEGVLSGDTIKGTQPGGGGRGGRRGGGGPGGPGGGPGGPGGAPGGDPGAAAPTPPPRPEWVATRVK